MGTGLGLTVATAVTGFVSSKISVLVVDDTGKRHYGLLIGTTGATPAEYSVTHHSPRQRQGDIPPVQRPRVGRFDEHGIDPVGLWRFGGEAASVNKEVCSWRAGFGGPGNIIPLSIHGEGERACQLVMLVHRRNCGVDCASNESEISWPVGYTVIAFRIPAAPTRLPINRAGMAGMGRVDASGLDHRL